MNYVPPRRSDGTIQQARLKQPWPQGRPFRILSIDGGGIRGVFPAAVLAELESRFLGGASIANHFDMIAGTSEVLVVADGDHEWWAQRVLRLTGPAGTGTMIVPPHGSPTAIEMTSQVPTDRRCTLELQHVHVHGAVNLSVTGGMTLRLLGASTLHSRPGT